VPVESNPHPLTLFLSPLFHTDLHPSIHGYLSQVFLTFGSSLGNILYIPISHILIRITYITSLILYHLCVSFSNFLHSQSPFFKGLNIPSAHSSDILSSCASSKIKSSKNGIVSLIDHFFFFFPSTSYVNLHLTQTRTDTADVSHFYARVWSVMGNAARLKSAICIIYFSPVGNYISQ